MRQIQHADQLSLRGVDRYGSAGKGRQRHVEMVAAMHGNGSSGGKARTHAIGADIALMPFRARNQPRMAHLPVQFGIADRIDGDTARIRQQQHIAQRVHPAIEILHTVPGHTQQFLGILPMVVQFLFGDDPRPRISARIQLVFIDAAPPRGQHIRIPRRILPLGCADNFEDMRPGVRRSSHPLLPKPPGRR